MLLVTRMTRQCLRSSFGQSARLRTKGVGSSNLPGRTAHSKAFKKKPLGLCGRQRLEGGISKEEEEKPRNPMVQEWSSAAIVLSNRAHQLCGTRAMDDGVP